LGALARSGLLGAGGGPRLAGGGGAGQGGRARLEDRADLDVVDPDVGEAGAVVGVEDEAVDVGAVRIDGPAELVLEQLLLVAEPADRLAEDDELPAGAAVGLALDEDAEGLAEVGGVAFARQDEAGEDLHAGAGGLEPEAEVVVLVDGAVPYFEGVVDVGALL